MFPEGDKVTDSFMTHIRICGECCPRCGYPYYDCGCHPQWLARTIKIIRKRI